MITSSGSLCIRYKSEYSRLAYHYGIRESSFKGLGSHIVFPAEILKIHLEFAVNGHDLLETDRSVAEELCSALEKCFIWKSLEYKVQAYLLEDEIILHLECEGLRAIGEEIGIENISVFDYLYLHFSYIVYSPRLMLENLTKSLNYTVLSLVMELESIAPFVFSVHSRRLLRLNYRYMKEYAALVTQPQGTFSIGECQMWNDMILRQISGIMQRCTSEYNTMKVLERHTKKRYKIRDGNRGQNWEYDEEVIGRSMWSLKLMDYKVFESH